MVIIDGLGLLGTVRVPTLIIKLFVIHPLE